MIATAGYSSVMYLKGEAKQMWHGVKIPVEYFDILRKYKQRIF